MDKLALLNKSWTQIAKDYRKHFVPRFLPFIQDAIAALIAEKPDPNGLVFVPGCGTGDEIVLLAEKLPHASFLGLDLAEGMIEAAKEVTASTSISKKVEFRVGDASCVPTTHLSPAFSAVFSCFTLQQMPCPKEALAAWTKALAPEGILVACFWPPGMEKEGPWRHLIDAFPAQKRTKENWDKTLLDNTLQLGNIKVILDTHISHEMSWDNPEEFWERMTRDGPWHSRRLQLGDGYMAEAKERFTLAGKYNERRPEPLIHRPEARLIVLRRELTPISSL